jgi:putative tryptophan/tyrosine transport system substrate-binding protein
VAAHGAGAESGLRRVSSEYVDRSSITCHAFPLVREQTEVNKLKRREFIVLFTGAVTWSSVGAAQIARKKPIIGVIVQGTPAQTNGLRFRQAFFDGLRELGYLEGRDFDIVTRSADLTSDLRKAAEELVRLKPDVIFAAAAANALAAKQATSTIPIVVGALGNPVALGLSATDSRRPTGNLTGIMPYVRGLPAKQLELAREVVPGARKIGIVTDTSDIKATPQWDEINAAASKFEVSIVSEDVQKPADVDSAFRMFNAEHVDVVIVLQANFLLLDRANIAAAAVANRLPTVNGYREQVETGGLISYGVNLEFCFRRAASYIYKILKGTAVADLPIEFPTSLELVINLKTAKALGLDVPQTLLVIADEVIE